MLQVYFIIISILIIVHTKNVKLSYNSSVKNKLIVV